MWRLDLSCLTTRCRLRRRTPGPPPFSSMNSMPAASRARQIAWTASLDTCLLDRSKSTIVESPSFATDASAGCVRPSRPRAPRHWAEVILSTFSVDIRVLDQYKMLIAALEFTMNFEFATIHYRHPRPHPGGRPPDRRADPRRYRGGAHRPA